MEKQLEPTNFDEIRSELTEQCERDIRAAIEMTKTLTSIFGKSLSDQLKELNENIN